MEGKEIIQFVSWILSNANILNMYTVGELKIIASVLKTYIGQCWYSTSLRGKGNVNVIVGLLDQPISYVRLQKLLRRGTILTDPH